MPIYYDRKNQLIFTVHHSVATIAFYLILVSLVRSIYAHRVDLLENATFLAEVAQVTSFIDRRRVAIVSLIFSIFFAITRNFMVIPYWLFIYSIYGTPKHMAAREQLPGLDVPMFVSSLILDALNIYWALMVYPIGYKAAYMLYKADWRTDFDRVRDRIRGRFLSARRRAMNTELLASLRRSTSFNLIQRAWEEWSLIPEDFSETEFCTMSVSERSSPLRRYSDSDDSNINDEGPCTFNMLIPSPMKSISSFCLFAELFLVIFFVDCAILSVGICENLKLTTGSLYYPNFQIYRFFTFFLVNTNVILFVIDAAGFFAFDSLLQRRWNFAEKMKFLMITTWLPGFMCLIYYYIKFACSRTEADLFFTGVNGSSSFVAAVTIVSRQLLYDTSSDAKVQTLYRYASLFYLILIALLQGFGAIPSITLLYSFFGLLYGWTYLRFFQNHTDGKRGDFRGSFSFARQVVARSF
ncbi:unnamed protein product [Hydatigera taeniaeformis]|uniref:TLC domain-containing protein n=1 Tax=Hydatigena taeniaeformis TaxID=6205 RepID=A0A0R3XA29_HYDTA|nr:unnamed protein product [Hydatigera taeniaeformis]